MDLTGSIADQTGGFSAEIIGSAAGLTGSAAVDTVAGSIAGLPLMLHTFLANLFEDLGSSMGG